MHHILSIHPYAQNELTRPNICLQESQVSMECVIPQKFHRTVMGQRGCKVQEITRENDVTIKFPDRPTEGDCKARHDMPLGVARQNNKQTKQNNVF